MTAPRRPRKLAQVAAELSRRDWAVLDDLARVRMLTGRQVQRLHVYEGSSLTQARRCRALLQRLHDDGLVHRLERRVGGVRAGSSGFTYGLTAAGQRLTNRRGWAGGQRLRRPWEPSLNFTDHLLAVSELYVELRETERLGRFELLSFDAEPACWRHWTDSGGGQWVLKPDAFVAVAGGELENFSFVELDRSTESLPTIRRKADTYLTYWRSGVEQQRLSLFPRVVFVTPDDRRQAAIVGVLGQLEATFWPLFQVVTVKHGVEALVGGEAVAEKVAEQDY
jgi:hypothetical protein